MDGQSFSLGETLFPSGKNFSPSHRRSSTTDGQNIVCLQLFPSLGEKGFRGGKKFFLTTRLTDSILPLFKKQILVRHKNYPQKRFHDLREIFTAIIFVENTNLNPVLCRY
jgi:hypothetical protein